MKVQYFKEQSRELNRDMEFKVYGTGGKLCLAFPSQNGRFYDFENFQMVDSIAPWLENEEILLICPDSVDQESWSKEDGDPRQRIEIQERWFRYITLELLPRVQALDAKPGKAIVTGCSMGGVHAGNFFFRRPDLFDTLISLSGTFDAGYFFHDYMDDLVYENSPIHFLRNMPLDHPYMELYRESKIILCVGQGAWEEDLLAGTRAMDQLLQEKGIPAWSDYWGYDVDHDWYWWRKQLPYFFGHLTL